MFQAPSFIELLRSTANNENGFLSALLIILVLGISLQLPFQTVLICCCIGRRQWLARILNPAHFSKGSRWQQLAEFVSLCLDRSWPAKSRLKSVKSPLRSYGNIKPFATGDLCDVSRARSDGRSFVLKVARVAGCDALLDKEKLVLRHLHRESEDNLYGEYFPWPEETFRFRGRQCSAFDLADGYVPATEVACRYPHGLDGRHIAWMFNRTLEALGFAHQCGWIHGAVLPPHLLFHPDTHGLRLIDWKHAEQLDRPLRIVPRGYQAWYPPECHYHEPATPATDIYLAAQSMLWLAGGDPLTGRMPEHLPPEVRSVLAECLEDSPRRRPQDAWELHARFRALLEALYGPPQFCHLTLSSKTL